jgi:hypothetical protein
MAGADGLKAAAVTGLEAPAKKAVNILLLVDGGHVFDKNRFQGPIVGWIVVGRDL